MSVSSTTNTMSFTPSASSTGIPTLSDVSVSEALKIVDQKGFDEQVNLSPTSLFLFELNTYANSLSDAGRNQFADTLKASGDPVFSQGFLDSIRYSMSHGGVSAGERVIGHEPASGDQFGVVALYGGSIPYNGLTINYLDDYASSGKASFTNTLDKILTDTHDDLSPQDRASIQSTFDRAIYSSFTSLKSDYDIFSVNYQLLIAQDVIDGFNLSKETSSGLSSLLSDIKKNTLQVNSRNLSQTFRDAEKFPRYAKEILASADKIREGIELNNFLQHHLEKHNSNLLDNEEYFTKLIQDSSSIESAGIGEHTDLFDYYRTQESQFKRAYIDKNWNTEVAQNNGDVISEGRLVEQEKLASNLASKYIGAVNAYLSTQKA